MKQIRLEEKITKEWFNEQWNSRQCGEVDDDLHSAIQANLLLMAMVYHMPFCGFGSRVCNYNM
jgi:hypothetical protein